jgi:hypothetical protein
MSEVITLPRLQRPQKAGVIWTPSCEALWNRIEYMLALPQPDIGLLIAAPALGKTTFLTALVSRWRRLITMDAGAASLRAGTLRIAQTLDMLSRDAPMLRSSYLTVQFLVELLKDLQRDARSDGARVLLMFDESQFCSLDLIETLRYLHDQTGVCMLFAGNPEWRKRIAEEEFGAFFTRIGTRLQLKRPQTGDVEAFCRHHAIAGARELAFLESIAGTPHALRGLAKVIEMARDIVGPDKPIRLEHLKNAARDRGLHLSEE